jgi:hypothetical protein
MTTADFTTTILVDQSPKEAFNAINNVRGWWTGNPGVEGSADKLNDEFTYDYQPYHHSRQKITEMVPGKKVVWLITESHLSFVEDKNDWTGTKIIFDITSKGDKTEVRFTHQGLVPASECYDSCSNAWAGYIGGSLRNLIANEKTQVVQMNK